MDVINIENNGPLVLKTNYFDSESAKHGNFFVSVNAGAFRLLVPDNRVDDLNEMKTAKEIVISEGPCWPDGKGSRPRKALEILFDDWSDTPYSTWVTDEQADRMPTYTEHCKEVTFTAWGRGPVQLMGRPAWFRMVKRIPCLESWDLEKEKKRHTGQRSIHSRI